MYGFGVWKFEKGLEIMVDDKRTTQFIQKLGKKKISRDFSMNLA